MEKEFRAKEICELSGATKSQLSPWVAAGAIKPLRDDPRRGGVRIYSIENLVEAMICKELANYSLPVRTIAETIVTMKEDIYYSPAMTGWQKMKKDPDMLLVLVQTGAAATNPIPPDLFKILFPGRSQTGKNAAYTVSVLTKEHFVEIIKHYSSAIVVDLKKIIKRAGMVKE